MKLAVVGSRSLEKVDIDMYIPSCATEIVSGGARGIDACVKDVARQRGIVLTEFLPQYARFKRGAPLKRNQEIVCYADEVMIFWDGSSKGTVNVIDLCKRMNKPYTVYTYDSAEDVFRKE